MSGIKNFVFIGIGIFGVAAIWSSAYVITEGQQAIITEFGRPVGAPVTEAGIHFKKPFFQDVRHVDKRILVWDGYPNQIPTKDKKYILVDATARWRISDPLKFIQSVRDERGAQARLNDILDAITRDTISNHALVEAVRNTNGILDVIEARRKEEARKAAAGEVLAEEEVTGEIESVKVGREKLSQIIAERADSELAQLGIKLIDVQIRRIAYEASVEKKVYERMISERRRIAEKIRSVGKGEQAKIEGKTSRDLQRIDSEAYRKAQTVKGQAEAKAIAIYAEALSQDPAFYGFMRTMEAYKKALKDDTEFVLSTSSEFLKLLDRVD